MGLWIPLEDLPALTWAVTELMGFLSQAFLFLEDVVPGSGGNF